MLINNYIDGLIQDWIKSDWINPRLDESKNILCGGLIKIIEEFRIQKWHSEKLNLYAII